MDGRSAGGHQLLSPLRKKKERKWPLYKVSMYPPLHDVNSRQHNAGVGSECQFRCFILPLPLFFFSPPPRRLQLLPQSRGNFPLGDMDLVKDRPVQNSWIHNFWGYISLLIYWAVIRIQRWMELEDIFKAAEDITGKPMRLVALFWHPWNTFHVSPHDAQQKKKRIIKGSPW